MYPFSYYHGWGKWILQLDVEKDYVKNKIALECTQFRIYWGKRNSESFPVVTYFISSGQFFTTWDILSFLLLFNFKFQTFFFFSWRGRRTERERKTEREKMCFIQCFTFTSFYWSWEVNPGPAFQWQKLQNSFSAFGGVR